MPRSASPVPCHPARDPPEPATPRPLLTSASRGWRGIEVALHHFAGVDWLLPMPRHVIGVHVSGAVNLAQTRGGRTCVAHVRAGDVTVSPRGEPKLFRHCGENVVIVVALEPGFLEAIAREELGARARAIELREEPGRADPALAGLGGRLVEGLGAEGAGSRLRAETLAVDFATHLFIHYGGACAPHPKRDSHLTPRKLQRTLEYIDAHLTEDMTLSGLARAVSMSPGHFAHAFKGSTGLAPHRFVVSRRVELARALLRQTDLPITEIAHRVGCGSPSHFSVVFQKLTGRTPRDFRAHA